MQVITEQQYLHALTLRDLTDAAHGIHAMQYLIADIRDALTTKWQCPSIVHRTHPLTDTKDNYDLLGYADDAVSRDIRYTRYVHEGQLLRTHMSATIPPLLRSLRETPEDILCLCPGLVYRRDVIDKLHVGEPHQLDIWRLCRTRQTVDALVDMISTIVETVLPGCEYRLHDVEHPYTLEGKEIEVKVGEEWVEIGECGLAHPQVLRSAGHTQAHGLAMGLGLDRILMLRKGIPDIRLLRSHDERVTCQMTDLSPYRHISKMPPIKRDMSIAHPIGIDEEMIGDIIRSAVGEKAEWIESISILSKTGYHQLPPAAIERLGMNDSQENLLIRCIIRHPSESLTHEEANDLNNRIYQHLHQGSRYEWAENKKSK